MVVASTATAKHLSALAPAGRDSMKYTTAAVGSGLSMSGGKDGGTLDETDDAGFQCVTSNRRSDRRSRRRRARDPVELFYEQLEDAKRDVSLSDFCQGVLWAPAWVVSVSVVSWLECIDLPFVCVSLSLTLVCWCWCIECLIPDS